MHTRALHIVGNPHEPGAAITPVDAGFISSGSPSSKPPLMTPLREALSSLPSPSTDETGESLRSSPPAAESPRPAALLGSHLDLPLLLGQPTVEVPWAIKGLLAERDIAICSGKGGIGKSYILMQLAIDLSSGNSFFGEFPVTKRYNVAYFDLEMSEWATVRRFQRMLGGYGIAGGDVPAGLHVFAKSALSLERGDSLLELERYIAAAKIDFILIDSVRRVVTGSENDSVTTNTLLRNTKRLRDTLGCGFMFLAHWRKPKEEQELNNPTDMLKGSTDWRNMADCHIAVVPHKAPDHVVIYPDKSRHEDALDPFTVAFVHQNREDWNGPFRMVYVPDPALASLPVRIKALLKLTGGATIDQILSGVKESERTVRSVLRELVERKQVAVTAPTNRNLGKYRYFLPAAEENSDGVAASGT